MRISEFAINLKISEQLLLRDELTINCFVDCAVGEAINASQDFWQGEMLA